VPPGGYTTITTCEKTAEKPAQLMVQHELETMSNAVECAVDSTRPTDELSDTELAHLLYQRLYSSEPHSSPHDVIRLQ